MNISEFLTKEFDPTVRSKGYSFYIRKQFKLLEIGNEAIKSEVYGVHKYNVNLNFDPDKQNLLFQCTCNQFKQGFNCPHIWASVLAVEKNAKTDEFTSKVFYFYQQKKQTEVETKEKQVDVPAAKGGGNEPYWKRSLDRAKETYDGKNVVTKFRTASSDFLKRGFYILDIPASLSYRQFVLHFRIQERKYSGEYGFIKKGDLNQEKITSFENTLEQEILWNLIGRVEKNYFSKSQATTYNEFLVNPDQNENILQNVSELGQLFRLKKNKTGLYVDFNINDMQPYPLLPESWSLDLHLYEFDKEDYKLSVVLKNEKNQTKEMKEVIGYLDNYIFFEDFMAYFDSKKYGMWYEALSLRPMVVAKNEVFDFLNTYWLNFTNTPYIHLPDDLKFEENKELQPKAKVVLHMNEESTIQVAEMRFLYDTYEVDGTYQEYILDLTKKLKIRRHQEMENELLNQFIELSPIKKSGFRSEFKFFNTHLPDLIDKVGQHDWQIFLNRNRIRRAKDLTFKVSHQMDWLDLKIDMKIGDVTVGWPDILKALKNQSNLITLADGTTAFMPSDIMKKLKPYFEVGQLTESGIKLNRIQSLFLKSYIENDFVIPSDSKMESLIKDLGELKPVKIGAQFKGELRDYQKKGVSWMHILSENTLGGILADDMGLGKTIQMLAVFSIFQQAKDKLSGPSLIVAPKSLVFNWRNEFEKFTPKIKVLTYFGNDRKEQLKDAKKFDVLLTTYHTLRNDIEQLKEIPFFFFVLDEAQNIKNPRSQLTLSTKLIKSEKKFALTGTPIENSIGDLVSILSVVNPGLITESLGQKMLKLSEPEDLKRFSKALSPFILRRTKEQVLKDLPSKTEQVLYCELSEDERAKYNEIKNYYWQKLNSKIKDNGIKNTKIEILGALLRLRQISCHMGLVDKTKLGEPSAKFDLLIDQIQTLMNEGHKALIFSSFTSLLKILSQQLREKNIHFEYLDGQTKDRAERVQNFQTNEQISLFLLSLKAGGVGLNLTSADYVFIIDPWWNPAAESQAIDRCYRIGQTKSVFAYKLIAKNTVEEKILKLQERKKILAENIISSDANILKELSLDDLSDLFS